MSGGRRQLETGKPPETKVLRSLRRRRFLVPSLLAAVILVAVLFLAFSIKTTLDVNPPGEVIIDKTVTVDPYNLTMHNLWCPNDTNKFCLLSWSRHGCSFFYTVINRNASFGNNVLNESERIQALLSLNLVHCFGSDELLVPQRSGSVVLGVGVRVRHEPRQPNCDHDPHQIDKDRPGKLLI